MDTTKISDHDVMTSIVARVREKGKVNINLSFEEAKNFRYRFYRWRRHFVYHNPDKIDAGEDIAVRLTDEPSLNFSVKRTLAERVAEKLGAA